MNDKIPRKKSKKSLRDVLRIISPIIETFLTYYYVSAPLLIALLLLFSIYSLEKLGIHSTLTDPTFKIGLYFAIWGFAITLLMLIQSDIKINRLKKEIKEIKEFFGFKDEKTKIAELAPIRIKIRLPLYIIILFLIAFGFILAGGYFYAPPNQTPDRPGAETWDGVSLTHDSGINFTTFEFNFVTSTKNQYLFIYYITDFQMKAGTHYAMLILPYVGKLEDASADGWKQYNVSSSNTSILYKEFYCPELYSPKCNDAPNLYFDFQDKIDAKQYYIHSINIPFTTTLQPDTLNEVNNITKEYDRNHEWTVNNPPIIRVTVNASVTQLNPIPDGYMTSFELEPTKVNATVFVWSLPNHEITFHLDFINPGERRAFDDQRNLSLILFGIGASFGGIGLAECRRKGRRI